MRFIAIRRNFDVPHGNIRVFDIKRIVAETEFDAMEIIKEDFETSYSDIWLLTEKDVENIITKLQYKGW